MALLNSLHAKQQLSQPNGQLYEGISMEGIQSERSATQRFGKFALNKWTSYDSDTSMY